MEVKEITARVDHTVLAPSATEKDIIEACRDALEYNTASVCIPSCYVHTAAQYLNGRIPVCTVIGFPNGYVPTEIKCAEAEKAIADGADEIDMVINIGLLKNGSYDAVLEEIRAVKAACGSRILKVIVETCLLTNEEKIKACELVTASGADFIKTSTGFAGGGATFEDVELFARHVGKNVRIKASGGIKSFDDAERFIELGASRLGTSKLVSILKSEKRDCNS